MTAATIVCEQCKKTVVAEAAEYSSSGKLLCANCAGEDRIAEGVARHAASRRKIRTGFMAAFAVALALSIAMFALGLGRYVQYTFLALAGASFLVVMLAARALVRQTGAHAEGARFLLTRGLLACAVSLVLLAAASGLIRLLGPPAEPELGWVPFTSPAGDCSIRFFASFALQPAAHGR